MWPPESCAQIVHLVVLSYTMSGMDLSLGGPFMKYRLQENVIAKYADVDQIFSHLNGKPKEMLEQLFFFICCN